MKKRGKHSKYTKEFRDSVAMEYLTSDKSCREIAAEIGVSGQTVYDWVTRFKKQANENKDGETE